MLIESAFDPFFKDRKLGNYKRTIGGRKLYDSKTFFEELVTWLREIFGCVYLMDKLFDSIAKSFFDQFAIFSLKKKNDDLSASCLINIWLKLIYLH